MNRSKYTKAASPKLRKKLEELAEQDGRHSLRDEVDLYRMFTMEAFELYSIAAEKGSDPGLATRAEIVLKACIKDLADLVERSVKTEKLNDNLVDIRTIPFIIKQVQRMLFKYLPEDDAERMAKLIERDIVLPPSGQEVVITID